MAEKVRYYLLIVAALLLSSYLCFKEPYKYLGGLPGILGVAAEVATCVLGAAFAFGNADRRNTDAVRRVALTMLLVGMLSIIVVNIVKGPWGRPRYRSIVVTEGLEFRPWYVIGTSERAAFEGILSHDEFKSFPSGHSCSAATALMLSLLPVAVPRLRGKEHALLVVGIIWPLLVMFFRIVAGAHFLSDVLCGALVSYTVFLILYQLVAKKAVE
jgi:membrane-associated phospholipid phosphatase